MSKSEHTLQFVMFTDFQFSPNCCSVTVLSLRVRAAAFLYLIWEDKKSVIIGKKNLQIFGGTIDLNVYGWNIT